VQWGTPLFTQAMVVNDDIRLIAADIRQQSASPSRQIALALQYVQSKVRYLGIEFGQNSHKPSSAVETLARHYGDCKDKTVLLITLLKELGVAAVPALVDSDYRQALIDQIPRYAAFDHVIVKVDFEGFSYWLDPTRDVQLGDLNEIYQHDFAYGLLLDGQSTELTKFEFNLVNNSIESLENFELFETPNMAVNYQNSTIYSGKEADKVRANMDQDGLTKTSQDYLAFYQGYYPSISEAEPMTFKASDTQSRVQLNESYLIKDAWTTVEKQQRFKLWFYANLVTNSLDKPKGVERKQPLAVNHPQDLLQSIVIKLPNNDWNFTNSIERVNNQFFSFSREVIYKPERNELTLTYQLKTKTAVVPAADFKRYKADVEKVKDFNSYGIRKNMPGKTSSKKEPVNWWFLAGMGYLLVVLLLCGLWQQSRQLNSHKGEQHYYPVSIAKFCVYNLLSWGLYGCYWFYRNWRYVKHQDSPLLMPIARSIFGVVWFYPFYQRLKATDLVHTDKRVKLPAQPLAIILALLFVAGTVVSYVSDYWYISLLLSMVAMVPLVYYINGITANYQALLHNSRWGVGTLLVGCLSLPISLIFTATETGMIPGATVIAGEKMLSWDVKYLQRKKVLEPSDKVNQFYSDDFLSAARDGNGFTERHVFSYWREDGEFVYDVAQYSQIKDIEVTWGTAYLENTIVKVTRQDDSDFLLYVSAQDELDKDFVKQLRLQWTAVVPVVVPDMIPPEVVDKIIKDDNQDSETTAAE
jgi:hypothetical protein